MPRSVAEGFEDFLEKLRASRPESLAAANHRASIEACLRTDFGLQRFVRIGSFGNGTSISGFSDVDYLACIPTSRLTESSTYSLVKIRNALDARFPRTGVRVSTPAVTVPLGMRRAETTEVVPADSIGAADGFQVYEIADGSGVWMRASPGAHNAYVAHVDGQLGGKVKPLIRFVKAWKYLRAVPISSFYLEIRVAKYAAGESSIVFDIDMHRFLLHLWDIQLADLRDPRGFSGYILACKSEIQKREALSKLATAAIRTEKAYAANAIGKTPLAFDWWRLLYGSDFPTYHYP